MLEVRIAELPKKLSMYEAVENCYMDQIRFIWTRLVEGVSVLARCEKQVIPYLQGILKKRLTSEGKTITIIDGRADQGQPGQIPRVTAMVNHLRTLVNNTEQNKIFFLPYLDIISSTSKSGLSQESKEIMTIIHENPLLVMIAFEDPEFPIPDLIAQAFPARVELLGIPRSRLPKLITDNEAKKFARETINLMSIFKYVSGLNPVRFREIMSIFSKKADFDPNLSSASSDYLAELRDYTVCGGASLSTVNLESDIAGYSGVKTRIRENILELLEKSNRISDEKAIHKLESIIPKGLIFYGPPGTGKTLFAKGIAEALNAAIYIVSGPELKSKWVGEGEANVRRLFARARATAPSVIVFDELDSIASARSGNTGDGGAQASHSMVNQLLTEMDGFRKEELVLVIGTTNFVDSIDPAFLRPGRFEFQIEIPYPEWEDRHAILTLYNRLFETGLSSEELETLSSWTGRATQTGTPYTGDHLNALIRDLKRRLITLGRESADKEFLHEWLASHTQGTVLTPEEERVVATHECGHLMMYLKYDRFDEITKVTLETGSASTLGAVYSKSLREKALYTETRMKSEIAISLGGYAAEKIIFGEVSTGASGDLNNATRTASDMVSIFAMGNPEAPRSFTGGDGNPHPYFLPQLSPRMDAILCEIMHETTEFLRKNRSVLENLTLELIRRRTLDRSDLPSLLGNLVKPEK